MIKLWSLHYFWSAFLIYTADDVNALDQDLNTIKRAQKLVDASKEVDLEINRENKVWVERVCVLPPECTRSQIKIDNKSFESMFELQNICEEQ